MHLFCCSTYSQDNFTFLCDLLNFYIKFYLSFLNSFDESYLISNIRISINIFNKLLGIKTNLTFVEQFIFFRSYKILFSRIIDNFPLLKLVFFILSEQLMICWPHDQLFLFNSFHLKWNRNGKNLEETPFDIEHRIC